MKFLGKKLRLLLAAALIIGLFTGVPVEAGNKGQSKGYRVLLTADNAKKAGLKIRHNLGEGKVTAHVSENQKKRLDQSGIPYKMVPVRTLQSQPGEMGKPSTGSSTLPQVPYGVKMIYGNPNLTKTGVNGGAGVTIAVLDTGVTDHRDFVRADGTKVITHKVDFSQTDSPQVEGAAVDGHGHGTHVTGTIAAAGGLDGTGIFGVSPQANIHSYKVLDDSGSGWDDDIAAAIRYAAGEGQDVRRVDIISMSLGSSYTSDIESSAVRYAVSRGVLVVAAAGNSGPRPDSIGYPAALSEVLAVASLNPDEVVSYYSSRGINDGDDNIISDREVEVAAPGRSVISTYLNNGYASSSGTSMATPHIAGLAAKMWQGDAEATRAWLRLAAQAHDITKAERSKTVLTGYDAASGYGLPQVTPVKQSGWKN